MEEKKEDVVPNADVPGPPAVVAPVAREGPQDPAEDDLDDLDDMLDEFATTKPGPTASAAGATRSHVPAAAATTPGTSETEVDEDFARRLQSGMADLLSDLETSPEMQKQFEEMFQGIGAATAPVAEESATAGTASQVPKGPAPASTLPDGFDESFQETIQRTMQRMRDSGEQATEALNSGTGEDMFAEMMKEMQKVGLDGKPGEEEDFSKILLGMMEQLTNKEILYEPMKELHQKYPSWLESHAEKTSEEDLKRYKEQQTLVAEIVTRFEAPSYSDDNAADREYIVERMQKMQAAGSPPSDLVGDLNAAQEALGDIDAGCPQQ